MLTVVPVLPVDGRPATCLPMAVVISRTCMCKCMCTLRVAIAPGVLFARSTAAHASFQLPFFNQWGVVGAARARNVVLIIIVTQCLSNVLWFTITMKSTLKVHNPRVIILFNDVQGKELSF